MGTVAKEEVQTLVDVCDFYTVVCHTILKQQLLQEQEGALVVHMLSHLQSDKAQRALVERHKVNTQGVG